MRGSTGAALILAMGAAGCGEQSASAPNPTETTASEGLASPTQGAPASAPPMQSSAAPPPGKPSGSPRVPDRLQALGTEPFWSVDLSGSQLVYRTPDDQTGRQITASREDSAISSTWTGMLDGKPFELSIVPEKCSDGMSDTEYPFSAGLKTNDGMRHGCARSRP